MMVLVDRRGRMPRVADQSDSRRYQYDACEVPPRYRSGICVIDRYRSWADGERRDHHGPRPADCERLGTVEPAGPGGAADPGDASGPPRARRPARGRAVGGRPARVGNEEPAGLHRPAPQGAGRGCDHDDGQRLRADRATRRDRLRAVRADGHPGSRAAGARRGRPRSVRVDRRAGPLAGRGVRRPRGMATVRVGRTAPRRAAPRGRGAAGRRPPPRRAVRRGACQSQALVREAPLRERRWTLLAQAHYQAGNQAEALRVLHQLKSVLLQQLGIDPGPDVVALEQAILASGRLPGRRRGNRRRTGGLPLPRTQAVRRRRRGPLLRTRRRP